MEKDWLENYSEKLKAIGHPIRLKIVMGLLENECNVTKICNGLNVPQATTSQHLGVLKSKGIIEGRREGTTVCYKVVDKGIAEMIKKLIEVCNIELDCP
jgi:ArsR family transcriptional regulator